jgi:hypothetical protein
MPSSGCWKIDLTGKMRGKQLNTSTLWAIWDIRFCKRLLQENCPLQSWSNSMLEHSSTLAILVKAFLFQSCSVVQTNYQRPHKQSIPLHYWVTQLAYFIKPCHCALAWLSLHPKMPLVRSVPSVVFSAFFSFQLRDASSVREREYSQL